MTEQVDSAITELAQALDAHEFDRAREIAMELQQTYDERHREEREVVEPVAQSYATQSETDIDTVTEQGKLITESMGAQVTRVAVMTLVLTVTETHEQLETEGLLGEYIDVTQDALAELESSEAAFESQQQSLLESEQERTTTDDSSPGFGVGSTLTALSGAGYLLKRRLEDDSSE